VHVDCGLAPIDTPVGLAVAGGLPILAAAVPHRLGSSGRVSSAVIQAAIAHAAQRVQKHRRAGRVDSLAGSGILLTGAECRIPGVTPVSCASPLDPARIILGSAAGRASIGAGEPPARNRRTSRAYRQAHSWRHWNLDRGNRPRRWEPRMDSARANDAPGIVAGDQFSEPGGIRSLARFSPGISWRNLAILTSAGSLAAAAALDAFRRSTFRPVST